MGSAAARGVAGEPAEPTRVIKKIAAHQPGAQRWARQYGAQLVCVRYRECPERNERLVTVELVVDRKPSPQRGDDPVAVRIDRGEVELRQRAKANGAQFDWNRRLWLMTRRTAAALGLQRRIVTTPQSAPKRGKE